MFAGSLHAVIAFAGMASLLAEDPKPADPPVKSVPALTGGKGASATDAPELRVYRLKHINADEALQVVTRIFGQVPQMRVSSVGSSNALLVHGSRMIQSEVEALLSHLDAESAAPAEPARPLFRSFPLENIVPDAGLHDALTLLIPDQKLGRFLIDPARGLLLVRANRETMEAVQGLLVLLREAQVRTVSQEQSLQLRLFWFASGVARDGADSTPAELRDAVAEIESLGVEKPRLVAQTMVRLVPGGRFETGGVARLTAPCSMTITGSLLAEEQRPAAERRDSSGLDNLVLNVNLAATTENGRKICNLQSRLGLPVGHPVVLGLAPSDGITSAFVVQLSRPTVARTHVAGPEKRFSFEMRNVTFSKLADWLSNVTGLPVVSSPQVPQGTFSFTPPSPKATYTIPQIMDLINETIDSREDHPILVRREHSFVFLSKDRVTPDMLREVTINDLGGLGATDVVKIMIAIPSSRAGEIEPDIRKLLSPLGGIVVLKNKNSLLIHDTAGNLRRLLPLIH